MHQMGKFRAVESGRTRCCVGLPQRGQMIFPSSVTIVAGFSVTCNFFALLLWPLCGVTLKAENSLKLQGNTQYDALEEYFADFKAEAQTDFDTWFEGLQDVLDENTAGNLMNMITALTARVDLIEAVIFNDITENPFLILFDDLSGVTTTGVWNESLQRIEC